MSYVYRALLFIVIVSFYFLSLKSFGLESWLSEYSLRAGILPLLSGGLPRSLPNRFIPLSRSIEGV